ncbi:MAG: tRNA pseudouridine(38-40) synthase TruA [Propionibacteriaceae bacterium]
MRLRLDISYDGGNFSGWATQPGLRTVQGELERWLSNVLRLETPPSLTVAGRTDAGVHARGQVAHIDLPESIDPTHLVRRITGDIDLPQLLERRLRRALPDDIIVRHISVAPVGFDARFSALWRHYRYRIADPSTHADPLRRNHVVSWTDQLDVDLMNQAAQPLLGFHDFAAFCKARVGATTIRTLQELHTHREPDGLLVTEVRADAFCHSMVRSLMGALTAVGSRRKPLSWVEDMLTATSRANDNRVMPAHGLCLEEVRYPENSELADRANLTRSVRCLSGDC